MSSTMRVASLFPPLDRIAALADAWTSRALWLPAAVVFAMAFTTGRRLDPLAPASI